MNRAQRREHSAQPLEGATDKFGAFSSQPDHQTHYARPGFPYENPTVLNTRGEPLTQAEYDKLVRLCQTHGLLIE